MKFYIRLEQLLRSHGLKFSDVEKATGISVWRQKHLCSSTASELPRDVIEIICEYLVSKGIATRNELPALLFAPAPEQFWELLYPRAHVTMCMGVRRDETYHDQVVIAADSVLQANVLYKMTHAGFQDKKPKTRNTKGPNNDPALQIIDPHLVDAWDRSAKDLDKGTIIPQAKQFYGSFTKATGDRALLCMGSVKSNPIVECVIASCFKTAPFESHDNVQQKADRPCPFMFAYRDYDPHPASVCGGLRLSKNDDNAQWGIHYETESGDWSCAPWSEFEDDAALLMYYFQRKTGELSMVMGGFSGRGTRCLAEYIRDDKFDVGNFWPPAITAETAFDKKEVKSCEVDLGVFVVQFKLEPPANRKKSKPSQFQKIMKAEVIPIGIEALKKRAGLAA